MKKVDEVIARGEKCIMFTQFLKVIHYLEEEFERKGINVLVHSCFRVQRITPTHSHPQAHNTCTGFTFAVSVTF